MVLILFSLMVVWTGCHQNKKTPLITDAAHQTPLQRLLDGNDRFSHLHPIHPDEDLQHLQDAAREQHPFAVVVCCSDSRISPELIFDQGVGDLFVIRTAGNIIGGLEMGSIEYAVEHLGTKLIVIMGHENCGAVKAFIEEGEAPGHIKDIVDSLKQEAEIRAIPVTDRNRLADCINANVLHGIRQLHTQSTIIKENLNKELRIAGANYDLDDFKVAIIKQ